MKQIENSIRQRRNARPLVTRPFFRYWRLGPFSLLVTRPFFSLLILAYLHTYIPTYLHTCIPAYLHTCKPAYLHTFMPQEEFARAFRIGGEWILNGFRSRFRNDLESILGSILESWGCLGGSWVLEAPKLGFWSILDRFWDPSLGPSWLQLRGLGASWGVLTPLGAVFVWSGTLLFPISWPIPFRISFYIDFGSQNDPKIIEKSMKNPCPHEAEKESLFPCLLKRIFKIISCWSQKGRSSKTMEKHSVFVHFLNINLCQ